MQASQNFVSHLIELRNRLIRAVLGMLILFIGLVPFANQLYAWLAQP
ncbi:MAG TPA: twin-arginine translocase subunit TatC, partial [Methylophilaceae bacterium]|nr:twin-arginine translocase subunit TatC [Methylophilaceae bacterium]